MSKKGKEGLLDYTFNVLLGLIQLPFLVIGGIFAIVPGCVGALIALLFLALLAGCCLSVITII